MDVRSMNYMLQSFSPSALLPLKAQDDASIAGPSYYIYYCIYFTAIFKNHVLLSHSVFIPIDKLYLIFQFKKSFYYSVSIARYIYNIPSIYKTFHYMIYNFRSIQTKYFRLHIHENILLVDFTVVIILWCAPDRCNQTRICPCFFLPRQIVIRQNTYCIYIAIWSTIKQGGCQAMLEVHTGRSTLNSGKTSVRSKTFLKWLMTKITFSNSNNFTCMLQESINSTWIC